MTVYDTPQDFPPEYQREYTGRTERREARETSQSAISGFTCPECGSREFTMRTTGIEKYTTYRIRVGDDGEEYIEENIGSSDYDDCEETYTCSNCGQEAPSEVIDLIHEWT